MAKNDIQFQNELFIKSLGLLPPTTKSFVLNTKEKIFWIAFLIVDIVYQKERKALGFPERASLSQER